MTSIPVVFGNPAAALGFAFALMDDIGALGAMLAGTAAGFAWPYMFGLAVAFSLGAAALGFVTVFGGLAASSTGVRS